MQIYSILELLTVLLELIFLYDTKSILIYRMAQAFCSMYQIMPSQTAGPYTIVNHYRIVGTIDTCS